MQTISTKPYLIRAIYHWCNDQGLTPYIASVVDAQTKVPPGYAQDGQIVLNISEDATHHLSIDNDWLSFKARFNGRVHTLLLPIGNIIAIYARENGQGMSFEPETPQASLQEVPPDTSVTEDDPPPPRGSHLKRVK